MGGLGSGRWRYHNRRVAVEESHVIDANRLMREGKLTLRALIIGRKSKSEMIGVFLALLELIREKKILVHQAEALGELVIESAPEEHRGCTRRRRCI